MSHHLLRRHRTAQKAMTLLEIMIVVAILGLLAGLVVTNLMGQFDNAKIQTARLKVNDISSTINQFYATIGDYPSGSDGLKALVNPPGGFKPFFKEVPKDPWGKPFLYRSPAKNSSEAFEVYSLGPDGQEGTQDDIYGGK
jgi:general secretion pathway protein G